MATFCLSDEDLNFVSNFNFDDCDNNTDYNNDIDIFGSSTPFAQFPIKCEEVLEPTPIAREGVVVVDKFPIADAPWRRDNSFIDSLGHLFQGPPRGMNQKSNASWKGDLVLKKGTNGNRNNCVRFHEKNVFCPTDKEELLSTLDLDVLSDGEDSMNESSSLRSSHNEQWNQRYQELLEYKEKHGNCLVPLNWPSNPSLAHWVKRQRYLFRMKTEGKHSTLTKERQKALESLGFVWDSHAAGWDERWDELRQFKERYGHCNVPKKYPENQQLAVWVKCQRRQFKLYSLGQNSNMTRDRIEKLHVLGFVFDPRSRKKSVNTFSSF